MQLAIRSALLAIFMAVTRAAVAGPYEDADAAIKRGDYVTAMQLMRPLADQGNPQAQVVVGLMYAQGSGVLQDQIEAFKWFRKAADQGYATAQLMLCGVYSTGDASVPQDYVAAHMWCNLAASRVSHSKNEMLDANELLNAAVKKRDELASKMTPAQIAEAQGLAREWKPK
jgi:uncharacterized protein